MRWFYGTHFGGVEVVREAIHVGADGRRYLITHGDRFDAVVRHARRLARVGKRAYDLAAVVNASCNAVRRLFGFPYWSVSQWIKLRVKSAVNAVAEFERTLAEEARRRHVDGIVCGHIHHARIVESDGLTYVNCGDWVESCTAVVEHFDGRLEIIEWQPRCEVRADPARARAADLNIGSAQPAVAGLARCHSDVTESS
jgi:UDP-2,3-diacylglucosamine pyrophosphatase LpxH